MKDELKKRLGDAVGLDSVIELEKNSLDEYKDIYKSAIEEKLNSKGSYEEVTLSELEDRLGKVNKRLASLEDGSYREMVLTSYVNEFENEFTEEEITEVVERLEVENRLRDVCVRVSEEIISINDVMEGVSNETLM